MAKILKLRRLKKKDWEDMYEYGSDPETVQYVTWGPYKNEQDAKDSNKFLRKNEDQVFAVTVHGKMIGTASLINIKKNSIYVGYILNKDYWGMGIGTQVLTQLMNFAYRWHNGKSIYAEVDKKNIASQGLLKKCGFEKMKKTTANYYYYEFKN